RDSLYERILLVKFNQLLLDIAQQLVKSFGRNHHQWLLVNNANPLCLGQFLNRRTCLAFEPSRSRNNSCKIQSVRILRCKRRENFFSSAAFPCIEQKRHTRIAFFVPPSQGVEDHASADRYQRRELPQNESVARQRQDLIVQPELRECRAAGGKHSLSIQAHARHCLRCP